MSFTDVLLMMFTAVLVENFIFSRFYGCCPFLGVSEKPDTALGMGMAVIFVMAIASAASWAVQYFILEPLGLGYMQTIAFILVIAALVQMVEIVLKKISPSLYQALGIFLPLITTNCAVLGVALNVVTKEFAFGGPAHMLNLGESVVYAFATAVGYGMALVLFAGLREHLDLNDVPKPFKGIPIALVTAGILAMAFMGFSGLV